MFNPWRHIRLAGSLVLIAGAFTQPPLFFKLLAIGFVLIGIGTINGLLSLEHRVEKLEKEKTNAKDIEA